MFADSDAPAEICAVAERAGALLASLGVVVVTGGRGGAMEAVCRGVSHGRGVAVGVLPGATTADANPFCSVVLPTGLGHARNAIVAQSGDFAIALGRSAGTLSEVCFAWMAGKTVLRLAGSGPGWLERMDPEALDPRRTGRLVLCRSEGELRAAIAAECERLGCRAAPPRRRRLTHR